MKRKLFIRRFFFGCIILLIVLFLIKVNIPVYIGNFTNCGPVVDTQVKIDGKVVFEDSLSSNSFEHAKIHKKLRYGFHTVSVVSKTTNARATRKIFLLPNQYIIVEYHPVCLPYSEKSAFTISTFFNPFYYE